MIKINKVLIFSIFMGLLLTQIACKSKNKITEAPTGLDKSDAYEKFVSQVVDFSSYEATANIITSGDPGNHRFKCILRAVEDSIIWGSLQKFGFEFARIKITPERFQMVNRIERSYIDENIDEVSKLIGINLEFRQFWNLLKGLPLTEPLNGYKNTESELQFDINFKQQRTVNHMVIKKSDGQLDSYRLQQEINPEITATVLQNYKDYKTLTNNKYFSYIRLLEVKVPTLFNGTFEINFDQIKPNAQFSTGFEIPKGYSRSDI